MLMRRRLALAVLPLVLLAARTSPTSGSETARTPSPGASPEAGSGVEEQRVGDEQLRFFVQGPRLRPPGGAVTLTARVAGVLAEADGCVLLVEGANQYPVVWPSGTSVAGTNPLVIELPSGEHLEVGEHVSGGGGYFSREQVGIAVPDACVNEYGEVAVFNPEDNPISAG
jgi:hypothetical protein